MGSDFTNDDIVKESTFIDDYDSRLLSPEGAEPEYYYIELRPNETTATVWGKIEIKVHKESYIPEKIDFFDEKGKQMRTQIFSEIKDFDGRRMPSRLDMVPLNKAGHKTTIHYREAEFDKKLPANTFSLRNLQKKR